MGNPVLQAGDVRAYYPSPSCLAFLGLELGEWTAGLDTTFIHCGVVMAGADGQLCEASAYTDAGVAVGGLYPFRCAILRPEAPPAAIARGLAWIAGKAGKVPYDWVGLLYLWAMRRFNLKPARPWPQDKMICSAFVAGFLRQAGIVPWPLLLDAEVCPGDLHGARGLQFVGDWKP